MWTLGRLLGRLIIVFSFFCSYVRRDKTLITFCGLQVELGPNSTGVCRERGSKVFTISEYFSYLSLLYDSVSSEMGCVFFLDIYFQFQLSSEGEGNG